MKYYFDNSATTLNKPPEVANAVYQAIQGRNLGNPSRGSHGPALQALRQTERTRLKIASFFHVADSTQVSFTYNATYGLNMLLKSLLTPEDAVITSLQEHNSVLRPLYQLEKEGVQLDFLGFNQRGNVRLDQLDCLLRENTKAVVLNHMSNVTGNIIDVKKVGEFCKKNALLFIVDVAQSAGVVPIDMKEMNIDALCFTGHKSLYGPEGTGGICLNNSTMKIEPVFTGGSGSHSYQKEMPDVMPAIFEPGTLNVHGIAGLDAGIDYVNKKSVPVIQKELSQLTFSFLQMIEYIPGIKIYGVSTKQMKEELYQHGAIVSLNLDRWTSGDLADALYQDYEISVRSGSHCAPLVHEYFQTKETGMVRFSFSTFNTIEELQYAAKALRELSEETE